MDMRLAINLVESFAAVASPQQATAADKFIQAATQAIETTFGSDVQHTRIGFTKAGANQVRVNDYMQGMRTQRNWAILRTLKVLADKYGVTMNINTGAAGPRYR
jgi:hypothetical protein